MTALSLLHESHTFLPEIGLEIRLYFVVRPVSDITFAWACDCRTARNGCGGA